MLTISRQRLFDDFDSFSTTASLALLTHGNCFPLPRESVSLLVLAKTPCRAVLHRAAAFQCPPGDTRLPPLERITDQPQQSHYTPLRTQNTSFGHLPNRHFIPNTSNFISIPDRASTITSRLYLSAPEVFLTTTTRRPRLYLVYTLSRRPLHSSTHGRL